MAKEIEAKTQLGHPDEESIADENQKDTVFVIMPFGGWFDSYFDDVFCPAIKDAGLIPRRADDIFHPGTIMDDVCGGPALVLFF